MPPYLINFILWRFICD